jgi:adenylate kinase
MHVILMGPQGSGKGTQAARLAPRLGLALIATGDLFRGAIKAATPLGREIKAIYDRGELVPDETTVRLVEERLDEVAEERAAGTGVRGALFDGFPRTRAQAEALDRALADRGEQVSAVVRIDVPSSVLIERLSGRRVCASCGAVYHLAFNPPRGAGRCDRCGGDLVQREDDTPEAVAKRLAIYATQTEPLLAYYRERGLVVAVDGDQPIEAVTDAMVKAVEDLLPQAAPGRN